MPSEDAPRQPRAPAAAAAASPANSLAQHVHVGTSGYSFKDWVGPFYPPGTKPAEQLPFYAQRFRCLELNVSYYRVPDPKLLESLAARTPAGFEFMVKLHADMTHRQSRDPELYRSFRASLPPLRDAGKLQGLLAQFPYSFKNTEANRGWLARLRDAFPDTRLYTEFRHAGWIVEPLFAFLRGLGIGFVSVDEPHLPGLLPPLARATTDIGYVRLHGRNASKWYSGGEHGALRYDYKYSEAELQEWVQRIRELVAETSRVYVFFNNCHAGQAPVNAQAMQELLRQLS